MNVRAACPSDTVAIAGLLAQAYPTLMAGSYDASVLEAALPAMIKVNPELVASGRYYIAEDEGEIVGCGGWSMEQPGSGRIEAGFAHLRHFATDPDMTRRGIGRSIFARCSVDAALQNATRFQAFSGLNAESFYQSLGLVRLKIIDIQMGPAVRLPIVLMESGSTAR